MIWCFLFSFFRSVFWNKKKKTTQNHFIKWNQDDHDFNDDSFKFNFFDIIQHLLFHFWFFSLFNQTALISEIRSMCHDSKFKILSISKSIMRTTSSRSGGLLLFIGGREKIENCDLRWYSRWQSLKKHMIFKINWSHYWYIEYEIRFFSKIIVVVSAVKKNERMD